MPQDESAARTWDVPPEQVVASSSGRHWDGVDAAEVLHPRPDFAIPAHRRHVLVFNLGTPMAATERRSGRAGFLGDDGVMILPAGTARDWHVDSAAEVRHLHVYLDPIVVRGVAADADLDPDRVELADAFGVPAPHMAHAAMALLGELRTRAPAGRAYAEALATVLAVRLLRHHSSVSQSSLRGPSRLPPSALRRATAYIEDNLAEDVGLAAVADAAHFSPYHFARLFKEATGVSPHQYIVRRRVERARVLLATTDRSLAAIAREVGFASGSHLALHFKRLLGTTPSAYR